MGREYFIILPLVLGYLLDLAFGDPYWLPHPIVLFGKMIGLFENGFYRFRNKYVGGFIVVILLMVIVYIIFYFILVILKDISQVVYISFSTIMVFYGLANISLIKAGKSVFFELSQGNIENARNMLKCLVSRETEHLSENEIRIAVFESMSENLNDGVIAPLFWYFIGGIPLMITYKMVNTLDSRIGYKNKRYERFGYFAAKIDDIFNFIPARLTALLMSLVCFKKRVWKFIVRYGHKHSSPNAGYPEAALAGILDVRFGGPNTYCGKIINKPYIGENERIINNAEIKKVILVNHLVTFVFILLGCITVIALNQYI